MNYPFALGSTPFVWQTSMLRTGLLDYNSDELFVDFYQGGEHVYTVDGGYGYFSIPTEASPWSWDVFYDWAGTNPCFVLNLA